MGTPTARAAVQRTGLGWTKKLTGQTKGALRVERPPPNNKNVIENAVFTECS